MRCTARRGRVAMKEIQRDGIHFILMRLIQRAEGLPVAPAASVDGFGADMALAQTQYQIIRRGGSAFSSVIELARYATRYDMHDRSVRSCRWGRTTGHGLGCGTR